MKKYYIYTPDVEDVPESNPIVVDGPDDEKSADVAIGMDLALSHPHIVNYIIMNNRLREKIHEIVMNGFGVYRDREDEAREKPKPSTSD